MMEIVQLDINTKYYSTIFFGFSSILFDRDDLNASKLKVDLEKVSGNKIEFTFTSGVGVLLKAVNFDILVFEQYGCEKINGYEF